MSKSDVISFSIFRRKNSPIYYAQFKLLDGSWTSAKSTHAKTKEKAKQYCLDYMKGGEIVIRDKVTFEQFAKHFFSWSGAWALEKRARGLRLSERWCMELNRISDSMLMPVLKNCKLTDIDEYAIEKIPIELYQKGYAGSYVNKALVALTAILKAAKKQKLIKYIPEIDKVANRPRVKGILTIEETKELFNIDWYDYRGYVGNLLACSSGLRLGELVALTHADIHLDNGYINIKRSWDFKFKRFNATTKTGKTRNIIIPSYVKHEIQRLIKINPYIEEKGKDAFLFFGKRPDKPIREKTFSNSLYRALYQIGISEKIRRERNITFHSWRHWFNSLLINAHVPLHKIQSITGHLTDAMTEHYYHVHVEDMADVRQVQESIFSPESNKPGGDVH
jgi:integrase